jgi:uncharacterized protein YcbX
VELSGRICETEQLFLGMPTQREIATTGGSPTDSSSGFVENAWLGRIVAIGESVRLKIDLSCARCVMTTLAQGDLPKDPGILRTAAQHNQVNVGVYASVLHGGKIRRGDSIKLE